MGRTFSFNLVELEPVEVAENLINLRGHAVTEFTGQDGRSRFLVTGGNSGDDGEVTDRALIVNPDEMRVEQLPVGMGCARTGHQGFVLQTEDGERIVLAGGDGNCPGTFDIYDPQGKSFQTLSSPCSKTTTTGAVPEVALAGRDFIPSGRILVPGNPMCAVDVLSGEGEASLPLDGGTPEKAFASAFNQYGFWAILAEDGLFLDTAYGATKCRAKGADLVWERDAVWGAVPVSRLGHIYTLSSGRFLILGGAYEDKEETRPIGWAIATPEECEWGSVAAGAWGSHMADDGFAPFELDFGVGLDDLFVLVTGGFAGADRKPQDTVHLLRGPISRVAPSWHPLTQPNVLRYPLQLKTPRAGHAVVSLANGNTWILGGGEKPVEIFVRGEAGTARLKPMDDWLFSRSPEYVSMVVLDTTEEGQHLSAAFANSYPEALFQKIFSRSVLFLYGSSDRGIGDGFLNDVDGGLAPNCESFPASERTLVSWLSDESGEGDIEIVDSSGKSYPVGSGNNREEAARNAMEICVDEKATECPWRQPLRVGLDGLYFGDVDESEDRPESRSRAVHLLVIVAAGDDCSQGIYDGENGSLPSSDAILAGCQSDTFNDYFGLPPKGETQVAELREILSGLVEDIRDLHVVVVGGMGAPAQGSCVLDKQVAAMVNLEEPKTVFRPDRLIASVDAMVEMGIRTYNVDICDDGDAEKNPLEQALKNEIDRVWESSDYLETCVPETILARAGREADVAEIEEQIDSHCQVVARTSISFESGGVFPVYGREFEYVKPLAKGDSGWSVRKGRSRDASCVSEWLVYVSPGDILDGPSVDDVAIVCID